MAHSGSITYGQDALVVTHDTPVVSVVHLEDPSFIKVAKIDEKVYTVVADALPKVILVPTDDIVVEVDDEEYTVTVVDTREVLTDFDLAQVDMYNAYGNATAARNVLYSLATLVNEDLPDGTNGVI